MAGLRNIKSIKIERYFGTTPDNVIWTNIAHVCGYKNVKFEEVEPKKKKVKTA